MVCSTRSCASTSCVAVTSSFIGACNLLVRWILVRMLGCGGGEVQNGNVYSLVTSRGVRSFRFPPRHFWKAVSRGRFPISVVCSMGAEFAQSGGAKVRAASRWRRVGSVLAFSSSKASRSVCAAAVGRETRYGKFILSDAAVRLLYQANGRRLGFLAATSGSKYRTLDS